MVISILAVLADRDIIRRSRSGSRKNFNPRGPCGPRRARPAVIKPRPPYFNPRGPCGPRPISHTLLLQRCKYFNPRGPCGPRRSCSEPPETPGGISILAVLADRDNPETAQGERAHCISILAVLADRDGGDGAKAKQLHISILAVLADRDYSR